MLELNDIRKSFGTQRIFEIPHFNLQAGIYWLTGRNGVGKTTLVRMLAGIAPFRGNISIDEVSMRRTPVGYRRLTAWADAEPVYPDFVTGLDLVRFYSDILRPEKRKTEQLIDCLGVGSWLSSKAGSWSTGMNKRISLLLACMGKPRWVFLDEPLITLDEAGLAAFFQLIRQHWLEYATGFIMSSHQTTGALESLNTRTIIVDNHSILLI